MAFSGHLFSPRSLALLFLLFCLAAAADAGEAEGMGAEVVTEPEADKADKATEATEENLYQNFIIIRKANYYIVKTLAKYALLIHKIDTDKDLLFCRVPKAKVRHFDPSTSAFILTILVENPLDPKLKRCYKAKLYAYKNNTRLKFNNMIPKLEYFRDCDERDKAAVMKYITNPFCRIT